ncbi:hypothetical protein J2Y89_002897 [Curtobacterium herbarum]|uniref:hypothetical protein n=1 Tax=Curtobacterium herbarum TaxID=150122 RepID=UPI00209E4CFA|nr:hypothetical protein [Curtobacterium herbarum]MCP1504153.1 hypothetical protein [Curtobacterium herbarum]
MSKKKYLTGASAAGIMVATLASGLSFGSAASAVTARDAVGGTQVMQKVHGQETRSGVVSDDVASTLAVTSPRDGDEVAADESAEIRGVGQDGASLRVYERGNEGVVLGSGMVNGENGSFLLETVPLEAREYVLVVEQRGKGNNVTTAEVTINEGQSEVVPVTVTTPSQDDVDNGRIRAGMVEFSGEATPFATITMDLWKDGRELFTTEANETGHWAGTGWVGESTYTPVVKQTVGGVTTESNWLTFSTVAYANLTVVRPTADDVVQPSNALFSGKGTPGATVSVWTGPKDSGWARQIASTTVTGDRVFAVRGWLSANTKYTVYTYQELGAKSDQVMNQIDTGAEIKDLADVAASNVGTTTTLTGKAQPGATVEFWTGPKDSGWALKRFTTTADAYGHFTVSAYLSTGNPYVLSGYQSWAGGYFGASTTLEYTPTN